MPRRRFFVPAENVHNGIAELPSDQAHHLRAVLRLRSGDIVELFDGEGARYTGRVELAGKMARIIILSQLKNEPRTALNATLVLALIKHERFEWAIQKSTELGVNTIVPVETLLCDVRIPENRRAARVERWSKIVREASKQSRRATVPDVRQPQDWKTFIREPEWEDTTRILFYERSHGVWNPDEPSKVRGVVFCIGPEGGWDAREVEEAEAAGFQIFGLGPRVLRAETAAIAALSILQFKLGDLK